MKIQVTMTVDLDVLAKSLGKILIAMGNDDKIQMCSVEYCHMPLSIDDLFS